MICQRCKSNRIVTVSGKTSDLFSMKYRDTNKLYNGYVPYGIGIGGGDYMKFDYCLNCGQIQDNFPLDTP